MGWAGQPHAALAAVGLAVLLVAGCGGNAKKIAEPSTTAPDQATTAVVPTTSTTLAAPTTEIIARYKQFWDIRFEANRPPVNPADPRFAQLAVDPQLTNVVTETRQRLDQGLALRRPDPSVTQRRVKVIEVAGDTATLQDCATNDGIVYREATGQVVDDTVVTRSVTATMRRVDGSWKVAEAKVLQEWKGVAGCALSGEFS